MNCFKIKYPIMESKAESRRRFSKICDLTSSVFDSNLSWVFSICGVRLGWKMIALYWKKQHSKGNYPNIMFEAIFHLCFKKFSENVNSSDELRLVLLVEEELERCGISFSMWKKTRYFKSAYDSVSDFIKNSNSRRYHSFKEYVTSRLQKHLFLKNTSPSTWQVIPKTDCRLSGIVAKRIWNITAEYEAMISFLCPGSVAWQEEWTDLEFLLQHMNEIYKIDFAIDPKGFDHLIDAMKYRNKINSCARRLFLMQSGSDELIQHFWEEQYVEKFQSCFLCIYRHYKKSHMSDCGKYAHSNVSQNWIVRTIQRWNLNPEVQLTHDVKKALFEISIAV